MKKLLTEILSYLESESVLGCNCSRCMAAREFVPKIKKELAKFSINEVSDIQRMIMIDLRDTEMETVMRNETLNKVLEAIK